MNCARAATRTVSRGIASVFHCRVAFDSTLDCLFPRLCVRCGRPGAFICVSCERTLVRIEPPVCPVCGRPQSSSVLCPSCAAHTPPITGIRSVFRLEGAIRQAIHELKYNNLRALAPLLAGYLAEGFSSMEFAPDTITPVPLHKARERRRGYNQSRLLAEALSRRTDLPIDTGMVSRVRNTDSQVQSRDAQTRSLNVSGAFACEDVNLKGRNILLVDDVCTTGATLLSCAEALRHAGALHVWGLTVAREI